jgi:hypothetical protein
MKLCGRRAFRNLNQRLNSFFGLTWFDFGLRGLIWIDPRRVPQAKAGKK